MAKQQGREMDPWPTNCRSFATGPWTESEHRAFEEAIIMYGKDSQKIQKVVKTRSVKQVSQRIGDILRNKN